MGSRKVTVKQSAVEGDAIYSVAYHIKIYIPNAIQSSQHQEYLLIKAGYVYYALLI